MQLTRRNFLKAACASAAVSFAGSTGIAASNIALAETNPASTEGQWLPSFCTNCHFPCCATQVKVENGVVVDIRGDERGANKGRLCARGQNAINQLYDPYRVQAPMKRTNPEKAVDNDPGWVEISWDEALEEVAQKLQAAIDYHPDSIVFVDGFGLEECFRTSPYFLALGTNNFLSSAGPLCPEHFNQLHLQGMMLDRLDLEYAEYVVQVGRTMGSQWCATSASHSAHYADAMKRGMKLVSVSPVCDDAAQKGEWVPIVPGTDTAFGLGLLNVILHEIGIYDEEWLRMRTNAPYLIDDNVVELVGRESHKGSYVRNDEGLPLVWDSEQNTAVPFNASMGATYALLGEYEVDGKTYKTALQLLCDYVADKTPEWQENITSIPAAKVREIANDLVAHAHIGETITLGGFEFPYRPSSIFMGRGMAAHMLGISAAKALATVNVLLGNIDVPGGSQGCYNASWYGLTADEDGVLIPTGAMANQVTGGSGLVYPPKSVDLAGYYPSCHASIPLAWKTILDMPSYGFDYDVQVLNLVGADPIGSSVYSDTIIEAFKKVPFTFVIANTYNLPTQFADIILPDHSMLERDAIYRMDRNEKECTNETRGLMGTLIRRPAVDPLYNTRDIEDIEMGILERIGRLPMYYGMMNSVGLIDPISPDFPATFSEEYMLNPEQHYTWREILDRKICSDLGEDALSYFDDCAFYPYELPIEQSYNYYFAPENQVRLPIYYERMVRNGESLIKALNEANASIPNQDTDHVYSHYSGLPVWYEENAGWSVDDDYPLKAVNWKIHYGVNATGNLYSNEALQAMIDEFNPYIKCLWISPETAARFNINEGDRVLVESKHGGSTEGTAHLSQFIHPICVGIPGNFGRKTPGIAPINDGVSFNKLLSLDESTMNPISLSLEASPQIRISKIG